MTRSNRVALLRHGCALLGACTFMFQTLAQVPATNGLQLWFRADAGTVTNATGFVTEWDDQSGNAFNAFQSEEIRAPKLVPNAINGKPVLRFDGSETETDYLDVDSSAIDLSTDNATFAVIRIDDTTVYNSIWAKTVVNLPAPTDYYLILGSGVPQLYRGDGSSFGNVVGARAVRVGEYVVIGFQQEGTTITHYLNGLTNGTGTLPDTIFPADGGTPLRIGSRDNLETRLKGDMAELLIYNQALSESDVTKTIDYLRNKYGILNSKPRVAITSPSADVATNAPATFTVTVNASDDDGRIVRVDLLVNGALVSSATAAPYSFPIKIETASTNVITAVAIDDKDATETSAAITITATVTGPAPTLNPSTHLKLWLRGDAGVTLGESGGVIEWKDQSGNANDALQPDEAFAPVMGELNGNPAVLFDAIEDYLEVYDSESISITGDIASFFVVRFTDYDDYRAVWGKTDLNQPRPTDYYLQKGSGTPVVYRGYSDEAGAGVNASVVAAGGIPANTPVVLGFQQSGTQMTHYRNGSPFGTGTIALAPQDADTSLIVGSRGDFVTKMKGEIAELLIYDAALSEDELANLRGYLAGKYSLPVVLSVNASPTVQLTGITSGASYPVGTNIAITATPADADGAVTRVEFFANGTPLGVATNAPYSTSLNLKAAGPVTVRVVVTDNLQAKGSSETTITTTGEPTLPIPREGLALWLQADQGVTVNASNGVTSWEDSSGNFSVASQVNPAKAPLLVPNGLNGKPILRFDGTDDFLEAPSAPALSIPGEMTTLFVVNIDDYATYRAIWAKTAGAGGNLPGPTDYYLLPNTGIPRAFHGATGAFGNVEGLSPIPTNTFSVAGWEFAGTTLTHYLDSLENGSGEITAAGADAGGTLRIGTRGDAFTKLKGSLAELVIYNRALTEEERAQINTYFQTKYALGTQVGEGSTLSVSAGPAGSGTLVFSWPEADSSVLESSPVLGPNAVWSPVTEVVVPSNGQNTVTIQAAASAQFFRLHQ